MEGFSATHNIRMVLVSRNHVCLRCREGVWLRDGKNANEARRQLTSIPSNRYLLGFPHPSAFKSSLPAVKLGSPLSSIKKSQQRQVLVLLTLASTMASLLPLPVLKDVSECADFSLTVQPYIHQLYSLPSQVAAIASSDSKLDALSAIYLNTNPLITGLFISLALAPIFLVLSEINRNYSQVDRLWSILPGAYVAHFAAFAHLNGLPTQKLDNVLVFSTMWGLRLTYNFWRKGGYQIGNEDYRWEIVKARIGPLGMFVLNVVFISTIQSVGIACFSVCY